MKSSNILKIPDILNNQNIALIGHMGSGKTLIGKLLAQKINYQHIDSDKLIEKNAKKTINKIFESQGEKSFRKIEENTITSISIKNIVLSLGGGSILSNKTRSFIKKNYITVFLDIETKILTERLSKSSKRPLLNGVNINNKIKELDKTRRKYYLEADILIKYNNTPEECIYKIINEIKKLNEKNH